MGMAHAKAFAALSEYRLVAGCDLDATRLAQFAAAFPGTAAVGDYARMLADNAPQVVVVATPTASHAALALAAAEAGARGVFCEKPMAENLGDARRMVEACRKASCALVVNHQRRCDRVCRTMRRLIEAGAIGKVELIRGSCAGDMLSDGTHTIDSIRSLAGDAAVKWVFGQVCRDPVPPGEPRGAGYDASGGWRYGHPIESGAMAVFEFATGLRAEVFTGRMQPQGRRYQDIEVLGTTGRIWRAGDQAGDTLLIEDASAGGWHAVAALEAADSGFIPRQFARMILGGEPHPLGGDSALADQEIVMAVHESARLRAPVALPLAQERYPLELMIEAGAL